METDTDSFSIWFVKDKCSCPNPNLTTLSLVLIIHNKRLTTMHSHAMLLTLALIILLAIAFLVAHAILLSHAVQITLFALAAEAQNTRE